MGTKENVIWQEGLLDEKIEEKVCYGGLDFSSATNLTCFCLVFPPEDKDEPYYALPYY